ncbi:hypothetical protein GCM10028791_03800 [Echinicola sediminis]
MQYGGQPSPILPDGSLLSLPIPEEADQQSYGELMHQGQPYSDLIRTLNPHTKLGPECHCHLDPDLVEEALPRSKGWRPLFGQTGAAQGHLAKSGIGPGDLFLFFGTFRRTAFHQGRLRYVKDAPQVHLIFGYLEIGKVLDRFEKFDQEVSYHPHAQERFRGRTNNCIYKATKALSFLPQLPGAGVLTYHPGLLLTKLGYSKSRWELPEYFREAEISYHSPQSFKADYFQSAAKGQEFVVSGGQQITGWAKRLIKKGSSL